MVSLSEAQQIAASQEPLGTEVVWATHPHAHLLPASHMLASAVPPPGQMPPACGVAVPIVDSDTDSAASIATVLVGEIVPGAGYPPPEPPEPLGVMQLGQASAEGGGAGPPVDAQPPAIAAGQQPLVLPVPTGSSWDSWADLIDTVVSLPTTSPATPPVAQDSPPPAPKGPPAAPEPAPAAGGAAPWGRGPPGTGTNLGNVGANRPSWTPGRRADVASGYKLMVGSVPPGHLGNVAASVVCGGGEFLGGQKFEGREFMMSPVRLDIFGWSRALGTMAN